LEIPHINRIAGLLAFGVMTVILMLAFYFMHARMLFVDAPFILTNILNEGHPMIMEHRYGSIITQLWPWLGSLIGMSLESLMYIYNASFNVFYLAVCALLVFKFKEYALAVVMALYYTLMVSDAFYWTNNEIHQAVGWMFLWLGLYRYQKSRETPLMVRLISFEIIGALAVLTHPLMIIVVAFVWVYYLLEERPPIKDQKLTILFSAIVMMVITARVLLSVFGGWYDAGKISVIGESGMANVFGFLEKPLFGELMRLYVTRYWLALIVFIAAVGITIYEKKYLITTLILLFFGIYNALFLTVFDSFIPFYSESELMPLTIIFGIPLMHSIGKYLNEQRLLIVLGGIFAISLFNIFNAGGVYNNRVEATKARLNEMKSNNITKLILTETEALKKTYVMYWGLPVESLFASIISGDPVQRTFIIVSAKDTAVKSKTMPNVWLDCFKEKPIREMNGSYFNVDSTSEYNIK